MGKSIETQADFMQLAEVRLMEAKALLGQGMWDGAYYLAGYAVELALKACVIKSCMKNDAFLPKDFSKDCYSHDLEKLVRIAKLSDARDADITVDSERQAFWAVTKDWTEQRRYERLTQQEAESLYLAISDMAHGVLPWIRTQWTTS